MTTEQAGMRRALIIGGGIGGLSTGIALRRQGWAVTVFERAPELGEVGAGLGIWANAVHALGRLGVADQIRAMRPPAPSGGVYDWRGRPIMTASSEALERRVGEISVVLHRAELLELLYQALGPEHVLLGMPCVDLSQDEARVVATFGDGSRAEGQLLVGADGIRSTVRAQLVGDGEPVYAGYTAYRGVANFDPARIEAGEYWGPGRRFGMAPMAGGRVYWWATRNAPAGERLAPTEAHALLSASFAGWADPIPALIAATDPRQILQNDIADRQPLRRWSTGRLTLLGDAAHPTTPNLGQGACQAIEDAVALADALAMHADVPEALRHYERLRIPRTSRVVLQSRRVGRIGQWSNPLARGVRDAVLRGIFAPHQAAAIDPIVGYKI
jgi:2-polyprenyl-6-methoxyphenol hydroxylase-like FAD-dependent oxidoreductase